MSAPVVPRLTPAGRVNAWVQAWHPVNRLILGWVAIVALTLLAYHRSLGSLIETTRGGGLGGYAWVVPLAGILAAIGVARRNRTELPIHDRQTDVIVGCMGLVLSLLLHAVLLQRYALYFHLLRLDLVAMWMFVVSAAIAMFGLRPVIRFAWVWAMLLMVFPLPYYVLVIVLGGDKIAAGVGTMMIAGVATGIAVGRHWHRGLQGSTFAWLVGLTVLGVMGVTAPNAPLLAFQMIPPLVSICLVGTGLYLISRRGAPKRVLDRKIEPLAAKQIWSGAASVTVVALALSLVHLPRPVFVPTVEVNTAQFPVALSPPAGWTPGESTEFPWVSAVFGPDSMLVRQRMVAAAGESRFDKFARPRTLVVDTVTTSRPYSLNVYPSRVIYRLERVRISSTKQIDLGYGVRADMFTAVDDRLLVTWEAVQWTWTNGSQAQRVLVIAVDNHEPDAPFPAPTGGLGPTLSSLFTVLLRGNAAEYNEDATFKDEVLLTEFAHALVRAQLEPLGVKP